MSESESQVEEMPDEDVVEAVAIEIDGETGAEDDDAGRVLVVDMKKRQSRKKVDKLRRGKGPLMDKVYDLLDELHAGGILDDEVQPVVVIVREKP